MQVITQSRCQAPCVLPAQTGQAENARQRRPECCARNRANFLSGRLCFALWDVGVVNMEHALKLVLDNWSRRRGNEQVAKLRFQLLHPCTVAGCTAQTAAAVRQPHVFYSAIVAYNRFRGHRNVAVAFLSSCTWRNRVRSTRSQQTLFSGKFPEQSALKFQQLHLTAGNCCIQHEWPLRIPRANLCVSCRNIT